MTVSGDRVLSYDIIGKREYVAYPLDEKLYSLDEEEAAFFKSQTGIDDDEELKRHILRSQKEAYEIFPYPVLRWFMFARLQISRHRIYQDFLRLGRERPGAIFLEVATCVGADVRKAVADGFPPRNCVTTDLRPGYWYIGYKLFRDSPARFPVPFLAGDALDPAFLARTPVKPTSLAPPASAPPRLWETRTLTPLAGHVSAIYVANMFQLFDEPTQRALAAALAGLLDARPGSLLFGSHVGLRAHGSLGWPPADGRWPMFCHSPESWKAMWEDVFGDVPVKIEVHADEWVNFDVELEGAIKLHWSVVRL